MDKPKASRQIATVIVLTLITLGLLIYLITNAGLDIKGLISVGFMTIIFFLLIKR
jgi:hypothetical protein